MNTMTKNKRTHLLILRDGRKFNITQEQYAGIRLDKEDKKRTEMFQLRDADTKELLFDGEYGDIKEFQERRQDESLHKKRYICSYGGRHPVIGFPDNCDCKFMFGDLLPFQFQDRLQNMGYDIQYPRHITEAMRNEFLKNNK